MSKAKFYDRLSELERLIAAGPANADVSMFKALVRERTLYEYAFEHLTDAAWIVPLRNAGFFQTPPAVIRDTERGIISYPWWPESRFLARIAGAVPDVVAAIFVGLADTANGRVHADAVDAANKMPVNFAKAIAASEMPWIRAQDQLSFLLPRKLTELIQKFANAGEPDAALSLLNILLDIFPAPRQRSTHQTDEMLVAPEPRARISSWEYGNTLDAILPTLIARRPHETFSLVCALLRTAVSSSRASGASPPDDYSFVWRRSIDSGEDAHPDIKNRLVTAVRDTARSVALESKESLQFVLETLSQGTWHVFERLALHLLAGMPEAEASSVRAYLCDAKYFDHRSFDQEYQSALRTQYGRLGAGDKNEIIGWIVRGPDVEEWRSFQRDWTKKEVSADDEREYVDRWQLRQLEPISVYLEGKWRERWDELTARYGPPVSRDERSRAVAYYEIPATPKTAEELASLSAPALIEFLRTWQPSEGEKGSVEGLASALRELILAKPEKYWDEAATFRDVPVVFIRPLVDSWKTAIRAGAPVPWPQLLDLCEYIVRNEDGVLTKTNEDVQVLRWTEQAIAELISSGLESSVIPDSERGRVWSLLRTLAAAEDPTPDSEATSINTGMDAATRSLNATRSVALHSIVRYALWVRKSIEGNADAAARLVNGFDEMPEVRELLDRHLDDAHEQSLAVRSVYGQWFPWLTLLDSRWAATAAATIFPAAEEKLPLWNAAWGTYITFCHLYDNVFDILRPQYTIAVSRIVDAETVSSNSEDAKLSEHLMVLYWRGKVELPAEGTLLAEFYQRASAALATHALAFVGQSLTGSKETVPTSIIERLQRLWESRVRAAESAPSIAPFQSELASYGWWFGSGQFPAQWALSELIGVLRLVGTIQADHQIVRQLPAIASQYPTLAVEVLRLLFDSDKEGLSDGWELYPRAILEAALRTKDPAVQELVDDTIDRLGERGHLEFRDLVTRQ